ncbi:MAG TPA: alternative ribosome rescue aminoacyl-tRNA hydrolase ArfB [Bacteroidota bacterium]|nr:alternative ribosome rescue aminoacyl-tRNA hydrolase ArfB [Bacteroidota bacterium]
MTNEYPISSTLSINASEVKFRTSRSSGPGGQNVNKLETRVELMFHVRDSRSLNDDQKSLILHSLQSRIDAAGVLHVSSQKSRSQWENKQQAVAKFVLLLRHALKPARKRTKTRPTLASRERRVQFKKKQGEKKKLRRFNHRDE